MTPSLLPAASQGSLGTDSASSNSKTGELVTKVAVFGAAVGLAAYVGRRYLTFRRRCLALDKHTAPGTDVDETFHTQPGSSLENAPTALVLSNEGPGVSPFQEGFARKSSAELSMLGSFLRHSVKVGEMFVPWTMPCFVGLKPEARRGLIDNCQSGVLV